MFFNFLMEIFMRKKVKRFYKDTLTNGQVVIRDSSGRFVSKDTVRKNKSRAMLRKSA
jgi:hypothetical protein